jgi:hypothetical protein
LSFESFAPIELIQRQRINLIFDAHSDEPHPDRNKFPPGTLQLRAPTQETLRWIPMTPQGIAADVKSDKDIPVLEVPRIGPAPLRAAFSGANDGTAGELTATVTNDYPVAFQSATLRFLVKNNNWQPLNAKVIQAFTPDQRAFSVIDLNFEVPAKSSVKVGIVSAD